MNIDACYELMLVLYEYVRFDGYPKTMTLEIGKLCRML